MDKIISPIKTRIIQFIEHVGITKEDFFETTDISASNFKGAGAKSELGGDKIVKIKLKYPSINAEWLLTGEGEILNDTIPVSKKNETKKTPEHPGRLITLEQKMKNTEISLEQVVYTQKSMIERLLEMQGYLNSLNQVFGNIPDLKASGNTDTLLGEVLGGNETPHIRKRSN